MGRQALANVAQGKTWRGQRLTVRTVPGQGGKSGERYEVYAPSLPPELYAKWQASRPLLPMPEAPSVMLSIPEITIDPLQKMRSAEAWFRYGVIHPVLQHPRTTPERTAAIETTLKKQHARQDGELVKVCKTSIYDWIAAYEAGGMAGLEPKARADIGKKRQVITRQWDSACPLSQAAQEVIAEELHEHIRSSWACGASGWRTIQQFATRKLTDLSRAAGWQLSDREAKDLCSVSRAVIEAQRKYSLIAIDTKDAKKFFDHYVPRIRRTRADLMPMDVLIGDVHPIDVAVTRPDGSIVYPRLIAWHDVATNRVYLTIILLTKGEGVRQEHVAASFASMCSRWGLPKTLYLDNGSEYSWKEMMDAFAELSKLTQTMQTMMLQGAGEVGELVAEARQVIRAKPYNAPAKPIEGLFSVLEGQVFSMIPGWVGGDRMRAKTHNVGQAPLPFPGTIDEFHTAIETGLAFYHQTEQKGSMQGNSPMEVYRRHLEAGWTKTDAPEQVLLIAFANEDTRVIRGGYLSWNGTEYYDDKLLSQTGQTLKVRVAKHDPRYAFVFDDRKLICAAGIAQEFGFLDPAGAKEQARRNKILRRYMSSLKNDCDRLDLVDEMQRVVAAAGPMPEARIGATVALSDEARQMIAVMESKQAEELALQQNASAPKKQQRLSQWISPDERDPYLEAVQFEEEEEGAASPSKGNGTLLQHNQEEST